MPFPQPQPLPRPRAHCPPPPRVCHPGSSLLSPLSAPGDGDLVKATASSMVPSTPLEGEGLANHPSSELCTWDSPSEGSNQTAKPSLPTETPQRPFPFVGVGGSGAGGGAHLAHARLLMQLRGPLPLVPGELRSVSARTEHRPCPTWTGTVSSNGTSGESYCHYSHGSSERQLENWSQKGS